MENFMIETGKQYTYDDYLKLDDDNRYELIEGELFLVPSPNFQHQRITGTIFQILAGYIDMNNKGVVIVAPFDVVLDEPSNNNTFQPDILFVSKERFNIIEDQRINGAPDLVIEVLSPSTSKRDRGKKSKRYFNSGVKEYWLVDPTDQLIEVFIPGEKDWNRAGVYDEEDILTSPLLPGLQIKLKDIFIKGVLHGDIRSLHKS